MAQVNTKLTFDAEKGSVTVALDLNGSTEMEHELLTQFFTARAVSLVPMHVGEDLQSAFVIVDTNAYPKAQRACENRIRAREGRPSVEQEEAAKALASQNQADAEKADADAKALGFANAADRASKEAEAARLAALAKAVVDEQERRAAVKTPPTPSTVQ